METLYHGLAKSSRFTGSFSGEYVCLSRERDLALAYAEEDPCRLLEVTIAATNPRILDSPEKFRDAWLAGGANTITLDFWSAGGPYRTFLAWAGTNGFDLVDILPGAFVTEVGHTWASSTVGEAQVVVLDPNVIICVKQSPDSAYVNSWVI
jgi:hypothetical protein